MKKYILIIISIYFGLTGYSKDLDSLGVDFSSHLNNNEIIFINQIFKDSLIDFDLRFKKVAFVIDDIDIRLKSKIDYFDYYTPDKLNPNNSNLINTIIKLNQQEKVLSGGYDLIVLIKQTKPKLSNSINNIIRLLGEREKRIIVPLDSIGLDNNSNLSDYESKLLNNELSKVRKDFDFTGKRISFFIGISNHKLWTKKQYFANLQDYIIHNSDMADQLFLLTDTEKLDSGGFDAIILSWSKILGNKQDLIKKLKKKK